MKTNSNSKTEKAALRFADAILRVWGANLEIAAIVMEGHRTRPENQDGFDDQTLSCFELEMALDRAMRGETGPEINLAKLELVNSILYVWYRVKQHLQGKIFGAIRELAIMRGQDVDKAMPEARGVIDGARDVEQA
ncbi:MAG: hypothetical protein AAGA08_17075 [Pseudomonadota bacterium]